MFNIYRGGFGTGAKHTVDTQAAEWMAARYLCTQKGSVFITRDTYESKQKKNNREGRGGCIGNFHDTRRPSIV